MVGRQPLGNVRMAADSTILRMVNLLMALSLGVHREQLEHRIGLTWPRPCAIDHQNYILISQSHVLAHVGGYMCTFLLRPLDARFLTMMERCVCDRSLVTKSDSRLRLRADEVKLLTEIWSASQNLGMGHVIGAGKHRCQFAIPSAFNVYHDNQSAEET
jgi:hypothetical protein